MTSTISRYFSGRGGEGRFKRKNSSTSSASDSCVSPESGSKTKQEKKKYKLGSEDDSNMEEKISAMQEMFGEMNNSIANLSTKDDIKQLREDVEKMCASLTVKIEKLESSVYELENEKDKLNAEVRKLRGENTELKAQLSQCSKEAGLVKKDLNDQEQYGRNWNLRVYGMGEVQGEESVEDCAKKCVNVFSNKLGVPVTVADIEIAHRSGRANAAAGRPRPILIRFFSRRQRGLVLSARRKLKHSGVSVSEDLTKSNYQLLKRASDHSATMAVWSSSGKILAKLKNGKTLRVDTNTDINALFAREMG